MVICVIGYFKKVVDLLMKLNWLIVFIKDMVIKFYDNLFFVYDLGLGFFFCKIFFRLIYFEYFIFGGD